MQIVETHSLTPERAIFEFFFVWIVLVYFHFILLQRRSSSTKKKHGRFGKKSAVYICTDNTKGSDQTFRSKMCAWSVRNFIVQNFTCGKNVYIYCGRHSIGVSAARLISHEHVSGQWLNKRCIDNFSVKLFTLISCVASFESMAFKCIHILFIWTQRKGTLNTCWCWRFHSCCSWNLKSHEQLQDSAIYLISDEKIK